MPRFKHEVDRVAVKSGPMRGTEVVWNWTYKDQDAHFHAGVSKLTDRGFAQFRRKYGSQVPRRTGRLARGFEHKARKRYGKPPTVVTQFLRTNVPYAYIVEHGGRGLHHVGDRRRSGHIRRIFKTERRKLVREVNRHLLPRIYGSKN